MITNFKKKENKSFSASNFLGIIAVVVILLITGFLVFANIQIKQKRDKLNQQVAAIEKQIKDLQNKNEEFREGISSYENEDYIEKVAREELSLQKQGEKVVGFILPPEQSEKNQGKNFWRPESWWLWIKEKLQSIF